MDKTVQQERTKRQIVLFSKIGLCAVIGFVVSPFIFLAIQGLLGILVAGTIGLLGMNFAPVLIDMLANAKMKALKFEASKNPIETLELDYGKRQEALEQFREAINMFSASIKTFQDKLAGFKTKFPNDSEKFDDQLSKMKQLLDIRRNKYKDAEKSLIQYSSEIDRAKAIWAMSLEAAKMNNASGMDEKDLVQRIKVETSIDAITTSMNKNFAELETSLIEEADEKQLTTNNKPPKQIEEAVVLRPFADTKAKLATR